MRRDVMLIPLYLWVSASICLHIVSYFGTNEVAALVERGRERDAAAARAHQPAPPSEVEFEYIPPPPPPPTAHNGTTPTETPPEPGLEPTTQPVPPEVAVRRHEERLARVEPPRPTPEPTQQHPTAATPLAQPPPQQVVRIPRMQHVDTQTSNSQAPQNPAFLSENNNNVQEQTQAALRNLNRDDAHPQVGGTPRHDQQQTQGNSDRTVSADERDVAGSRDHVPNTSHNPSERDTPAPRIARAVEPRTVGSTATDHQTLAGRPGERGATGREGAPGEASTDAQSGVDPSVVTAYSGNASLSIASVARSGASTGEGGQNGANGAGGSRGANGSGGHQGGAQLGEGGVDVALTPTTQTYESVYGPEAQRERVEAQQRRSRARGSYEESWRENRASIENYLPSVRVGNQTSLRTAQSPFSAYLTAMHRRIHRLYAEGFIADLGGLPSNSPLNDMSLVTTLEIVLERDGRIHRLGVVRTSGNLAFDVGSLNSVRHAAPFGPAPDTILSGDGRVYMHWGFYRNERQCGTFNVDPYILPHPGPEQPGRPVPHTPGPSDEHPPMPPGALGSVEHVRPAGVALAGR